MKFFESVLFSFFFTGIVLFSVVSSESDAQMVVGIANSLLDGALIPEEGENLTQLQMLFVSLNNKTRGTLYRKNDTDISDVQGNALTLDGLTNGAVIPKEGEPNNPVQDIVERINDESAELLYKKGENGAKA